jgi:hypothetical protein
MQPVLSGEDKSFAFVTDGSIADNTLKVKVRALIVGVDRYPNNQLAASVNDANRFVSFLKAHALYSDDSMRILTDADATNAKIKESLQWLVDTAKPDECVVFLFSGHLGRTLNEQGRNALIVPVDLQEFPIHQIAHTVSMAIARQKIIIID